MLRTPYENLESEEWWRNLNLDGLILYSWAAPRYNKIAEAVHNAGIKVLVNMDTHGLVSPLANQSDWFREGLVPIIFGDMSIYEKLKDLLKFLVESAVHPVSHRRLKHYTYADVVSACTPHAARWIPCEASSLGRPELASKFIYLPHPQLKEFHYDETRKEPLVITVGRWRKTDWGQKNPRVLIETYRRFLKERPDWRGMIVGAGAPNLCRLLNISLDEIKDRLIFSDHIPAESLPSLYRMARIGLWSSRWEGQQGTAAQALCCGCSVVAPFSGLNSCFRHYVSRESGRIASRNNSASLTDELILEANAWESGQRDPNRISDIWCNEFHADRVAQRAMQALNLTSF